MIKTRPDLILSNNNSLHPELEEVNDIFVLPILELFLFWNVFSTTQSENAKLLTDSFIRRIDEKLQIFNWKNEDHQERHLFLILMKGICLKSVGKADEAIECFSVVLRNEHLLNLYAHLAPLACLELGMLFKQKEDYSRAEKYLYKSMDDYSHYLNETLVHIRAHSALTSIKEDLKSSTCSHEVVSKTSSTESLTYEDALESQGC